MTNYKFGTIEGGRGSLRLVIMRLYWERVDDYGRVVRLGPGDSITISITTEVGVSAEESTQIARSLRTSLSAWMATIESQITKVSGIKVQTMTREAVTYTRTFSNSDPRRRSRLLTFWRPAIQVQVHALKDLEIAEIESVAGWPARKFNQRFGFLWLTPTATHVWELQSELQSYVSGQLEVSEQYE
jgi:hypothetical protein